MDDLRNWLEPLIENFETQSGSGENGPMTIRTYVRVMDITGVPNPEAIPVSSDPANVDFMGVARKAQKLETKRAQKTSTRPSSIQAQTLSAVNNLEDKINSGFDRVVQALKTSPLSIIA